MCIRDRCCVLVERQTEDAQRIAELDAVREGAEELDRERAERWEERCRAMQSKNMEVNMKLAKVAAGGKAARKDAAEVLVAQVHTLEEELRIQWSKHQAQLEQLENRLSAMTPADHNQELVSQLQQELHQRQAQAATVAEMVLLRDSTAEMNIELETLRRENGQLRGLLVARGGAELVDDSGPLSCLSEVIQRRDETIAELRNQVLAAQPVPGWDVPATATWQKTVESVPDVIQQVQPLSARPWEGLGVKIVFDSSEEGLQSLDSLDQFDIGERSNGGFVVEEESLSVSVSECQSDYESIDADGA
eukprot:TRINITY_DN13022_c0_g2_i1.p2 TRINITY_DN13022_c0_g2~~TRINITY_DN13022_c0_g2_i1.p2  ORF type:complete len:305 (+),score=99.98 TRINITY_DN13022_c0_g2_i1:123-1037(+)